AAHVFDARAEEGGVGSEAGRGEIAFDQRGVDGIGGEHAALEREHDTGGEDGIEKGEGVADQQQSFRAAVAGMVGVFAGEEILADLPAAGEVLLDPLVLLDLAFEDVLGRFDAVAREVFALGNDTDADHVVVLRDVPEPAFFGDIGDGGGAGVYAFIAVCALVVGPDGDLVEEGILHTPVVADGGEGFLAGAIECDGGAVFDRRGAAGLGARADEATDLAEQFGNDGFLAYFGALVAGVVKEHLIEFRAEHLPGLSDGFAVVAVEEIKRLAGAARRGDELHAVFFDEGRFLHLPDQAEAFERLVGEREERFADVIAGEFFAFENEHAVAAFGEQGGGGGAGWAGADDENVAVGFRSHEWLMEIG